MKIRWTKNGCELVPDSAEELHDLQTLVDVLTLRITVGTVDARNVVQRCWKVCVEESQL